MITKRILYILSAILVGLMAMAADLPIDPELRHGALPNGFTYYIRHNATPAHRAYFYLVHRVGSVMEQESERGLAHFLEHMAFTGTKNYDEYELFSFLTANGLAFGSDVNASTSYDDTQYYIKNVPTSRQSMLDSVLYVMRDLSCNLSLDSLNIDKQRAIIHDERTAKSAWHLRLQEQALSQLLAGSRYAGRLPIGLPQVVETATTSQLQEFYHRWYRPDRQALIVVGDIDAALLERKVRRIFGVMPTPIDPAPTVDLTLPDHKGLRTVIYTDPEADATMVSLYFKHDGLPRSERGTMRQLEQNMCKSLALYMLNQRLNQLMRQPQSPMNYVQASDDHFLVTRSKEAFALTATSKSAQVQATVQQLLTEARRMALHGFTDDELRQARAALSANLRQYAQQVDQHQSADYVDEYIDHFMCGSYIPGVTQEVALSLDALERITLADVNRHVQHWVSTDNACLLIAGPDNDSYPTTAQLQHVFATALHARVEAYRGQSVEAPSLLASRPEPAAIVSRQYDLDLHTTTLVLEGGAEVVIRPDTLKAGEVLFDAVARGGQWAHDSTRATELQVLEAVVEESRLGGFTQNQLRTLLADKQVALSFTLGENCHDLQGGCNTADLETLMQLIHLYFTDVKPDSQSFEAVMAWQRSMIEQQQGKPEARLADSIAVAHYGHNPAVMMPSLEQFTHIKVDTLMQLYRQYVARPDQFTFIFAGDLDVDTVAALAQRYIGSLHAIDNQPALEPAHPILLVPGERTVTVQAPPATERAMIQITQSGPMEWSLEHELLTLFYGHVVEAVVNAVLREEHQLTYGVQATTQLLRTQPRWSLQLQYACKPHDVDSSLFMLNQAIELIASRGVSDQLFGKVKQMMLRQHADDVATNAYWVNVLRNRALERDIHTDLTRLLEELTSDQFDTFANHLTRDTHITVLYTP